MTPVIKQLVFSGGGPVILQMLGALQELEHRGFIDLSRVTSMYGTSAGGILAVALALRFDWETLNNYILKRPWQDVFGVTVQHLLHSYSNRGLFGKDVVIKCFKPLFDAKDLSLDITLQEFFEWSGVDLHLVAFDINAYCTVRVSHTTHPDLCLMNAVQMTCALPVLLSPVLLDGQCLMDGGVACNYPLHFCLEDGHDPKEVLGFKNHYASSDISSQTVGEQSTLLDYLLNFLFKAVFRLRQDPPTIPHEVVCDTACLTFDLLSRAISSAEVRTQLFDQGKQHATAFLQDRVQELD